MDRHEFDVAVLGGGPAGMMAAGRAAECGARVILLEKNLGLGKKLLITGGGRCNIFNAEYDVRLLSEKYGKKGKALLSVFSQFDAEAAREFFESRSLPIKVEAEKRAFPITEKAEDVQKLMIRYMKNGNVTVMTDCRVTGLEEENGSITKVVLQNGEVKAKNYILATGGKSRPETGSTGDGFTWMTALGHTVIHPDPALVPVTLKDKWVSDLSGLSLTGVRLTSFQDGAKQDSRVGKMLFTHTGLSGPLVLNMSKGIGELLKYADVTLALDLFPKMDIGALDNLIRESFESETNKMFKNAIAKFVQPRLGEVLLKLTKINGDVTLRQLTKPDRLAFAKILKTIPMHVSGLLGTDKAIVTGGGVDLKEVEFKTMRSKKFPNLFFAGDILDFDRPSGGYSLQICWTTGFVAGSSSTQK